jgi:vancomycin resistance protein YoaR
LGDGGGVCQVSTTLFRSVLDAGLKVTRRLPHSYRVSYYELDTKPGVDATVYAGETDFRFINDTDHHILIHAEADSKTYTCL